MSSLCGCSRRGFGVLVRFSHDTPRRTDGRTKRLFWQDSRGTRRKNKTVDSGVDSLTIEEEQDSLRRFQRDKDNNVHTFLMHLGRLRSTIGSKKGSVPTVAFGTRFASSVLPSWSPPKSFFSFRDVSILYKEWLNVSHIQELRARVQSLQKISGEFQELTPT